MRVNIRTVERVMEDMKQGRPSGYRTSPAAKWRRARR